MGLELARVPRREARTGVVDVDFDLCLKRVEAIEAALAAKARDEVHAEVRVVDLAAEVGEDVHFDASLRLVARVDRGAHPDVHHAWPERKIARQPAVAR